MINNITKNKVKKFEVSIITSSLLLSSISLIMFMAIPVSACHYTVGTYESNYETAKNSFYLGETVYGRGNAYGYNYNLKLRIRDPDGIVVYYSGVAKYEVTGSYSLNYTAKTGVWNIQLGIYKCGCWRWSSDSGRISYFTVSNANFTLTVNTDGEGSVDKDPDKDDYEYGEIVNLTAIPDSCWSFSHWSGDLSGDDNPAEIVMDDDKTVTAHFVQNQYSLSVNIVGNGSVIKNPDLELYLCGSEVNLTATPDDGFIFDHWEGDLSGNSNPDSIIMDDNKAVTAVFVEQLYTLVVNIEPSGSGDVNVDSVGPYHNGDVVDLTAVPIEGFEFDHWSGDLSGDDNPAEIVMDDDKTVTAHFESEEIYYTLTIEIEGNGSVEKDPDQLLYEHGEVVDLSAIADLGWQFINWTGALNSDNETESIIMDSNKIVIAHFEQSKYTLTINVDGSGSVLKNPDLIDYLYGTIVELTANPGSGYVFDYWSGNLTGSSNPTEINMTENKIITVHFKVSQSNGGGGTSNGGGGSSTNNNGGDKPYGSGQNIPPKAIAGGPYYGFVNEAVTFNGSKSYDIHHYIVFYQWDLGDGSIAYGAIVTHNYSEVGEYKVVLTVTDKVGETGSNETVAIIIKRNNPPSTPDVTGPINGIIDIEYTFAIVSTDDGDEVKYIIDWGDDHKTESTYMVPGELYNVSHKWINPGTYTINITADDGENNATTEFTIEIDDKPNIPEANNFILIILALLALMFLLLFYLLVKKDKKEEQENKK